MTLEEQRAQALGEPAPFEIRDWFQPETSFGLQHYDTGEVRPMKDVFEPLNAQSPTDRRRWERASRNHNLATFYFEQLMPKLTELYAVVGGPDEAFPVLELIDRAIARLKAAPPARARQDAQEIAIPPHAPSCHLLNYGAGPGVCDCKPGKLHRVRAALRVAGDCRDAAECTRLEAEIEALEAELKTPPLGRETDDRGAAE